MSQKKSQHTWQREAMLHSARRYAHLVQLMTEDSTYACTLAEVIDPADADGLAKALLHISGHTNSTLKILEGLVQKEFERNYFDPTAILRGNCVASKMQGIFSRQVGSDYLKQMIGAWLKEMIHDDAIPLEIDPIKLQRQQGVDATAASQMAGRNIKGLERACQKVFDLITSEESLNGMPREIKCIAGIVGDCARVVCPDHIVPLVGGFVMLRFMAPAIVSPEGYGLLGEEAPSASSRRNLILVAKVLQNLTNGVQFGNKEAYMIPMNGFIERNLPVVREYLSLVGIDQNAAVDSKGRYLTEPWEELLSKDDTKETQIDVKMIDIMQLVTLHRLLDSNVVKLMDRLLSTREESKFKFNSLASRIRSTSVVSRQDDGDSESEEEFRPQSHLVPDTDSDSEESEESSDEDLDFMPAAKREAILAAKQPKTTNTLSHLDKEYDNPKEPKRITQAPPLDHGSFLGLIAELGPPPPITAKLAEEVQLRHGTTHVGATSSGSGRTGGKVKMPEKESFAQTNAIYLGPKSKKVHLPIFYFIASRLKEILLRVDNILPLAQFIQEVMGKDVEKPYIVILDMSWFHISDKSVQVKLFEKLSDLIRLFTHEQRKNLSKLFILQPNAMTKSGLLYLRAFTSKKLSKKIHEIFDWKELTETIPAGDVALPDESKDYMTKSYRVVKINHKGKRQNRLIKFTSTSLLNIEPKSRQIKNELSVSQIIELTARPGSLEIEIVFDDTLQESDDGKIVYYKDRGAETSAQKHTINFTKHGRFKNLFETTLVGRQVRRYEARNEQDKAAILADLFFVAWNLDSVTLSQQFAVVKVNKAGKKQDRVFKLTQDSLLNLKGSEIRSEISFAGIESVENDPETPNELQIVYKARKDAQRLIFRGVGGASEMILALRNAIQRYNVVEARAEDERLQQNVDGFGM